jgi:hypothetical protein
MYPSHLGAELARQRTGDRLTQAAHQRLVRHAHRHPASFHPHSRPIRGCAAVGLGWAPQL